MLKRTLYRGVVLQTLAPLPLLIGAGTAWAHTPDAGLSRDSGLGWLLLGGALAGLGLAVWLKRMLGGRSLGPVLIRLSVLAVLTLYLATLGPHLSHHITEAAAAESHCTVLTVTDSTYSGLAEGQPIPVPAPDPVSVLPVPQAQSVIASFCPFPHPRAPPVPLS